jgi:hypothetical protein
MPNSLRTGAERACTATLTRQLRHELVESLVVLTSRARLGPRGLTACDASFKILRECPRDTLEGDGSLPLVMGGRVALVAFPE